MSGKLTTARRVRVIAPSVFLAGLSLANLAALWFGIYKILPLTLFSMAAVMLAMFRPVAPVLLARITPPGLALLAVYLYTGAAATWSPDPAAALNEFSLVVLAMIPAMLFGYFLGSRFTVQEIGLAFGIVPVIFVLEAAYNQIAIGDAMLIGEFSIRSLLGGVTCLTTPLLLAAYFQRPRALIGIEFLVSLLLAFSIQSRSSVIIVGPAVLYVIFRHSHRAFVITLVAGLLAILAAIAVNVDQIENRFSTENTSLDISSAVLKEAAKPIEERVDFDRRLAAFVSTELFLDHPLRGGGYSSVLQTNEGEYSLKIVSHGFVPGTAGELGLLGLSVILTFFYRLYRLGQYVHGHAGQKSSIASTGFWCGLTALVVYGFFHQTFESAVFGVAVGIAFGLMATAVDRHRPVLPS